MLCFLLLVSDTLAPDGLRSTVADAAGGAEFGTAEACCVVGVARGTVVKTGGDGTDVVATVVVVAANEGFGAAIARRISCSFNSSMLSIGVVMTNLLAPLVIVMSSKDCTGNPTLSETFPRFWPIALQASTKQIFPFELGSLSVLTITRN